MAKQQYRNRCVKEVKKVNHAGEQISLTQLKQIHCTGSDKATFHQAIPRFTQEIVAGSKSAFALLLYADASWKKLPR
jgi:hypothetical protein